MAHATIHVVSVGHTMNEREIGRAIYHRSEYKFDQPVKEDEMPPFPSAPTYDAKAWKFIQELSDKKGDNIILERGCMKHFYERNDYVLDHEVNKTFEEVLWMSDDEFRQWLSDMRKDNCICLG